MGSVEHLEGDPVVCAGPQVAYHHGDDPWGRGQSSLHEIRGDDRDCVELHSALKVL